MIARRARIYDTLALLTAIVVIVLDQWTKALVVQYLSPPASKAPIPLIGNYLTIFYIQNSGAAFGLFANNIALAALIASAVCVITYLYVRTLNSAPLVYKLIFGMIIGGAVGNLVDRAIRGGFVVDFIYFRIPEINYHFAVFNLADASISVGVFLLFLFILLGGLHKTGQANEKSKPEEEAVKGPISPTQQSGTLCTREQDAQP
ncbi:MAG: signal peptidase II [Ktedonobacteraceae bacterium]